MEEIKSTGPETNYIELSQAPKGIGNIFDELWGVGDLTIDTKEQTEMKKKDPLLIAYSVSGKLLILGIIITLLLSLDVFARSSEENSLFVNLPICSYLTFGIEDYDNTECKTPIMVSANIDAEKDKLEKDIITNLVLLVPKLIQTLGVINSPKVQFIQEHTGNSRVSIAETIQNFLDVKNRTSYQWKDIECKTLSIDEKWIFSTSCQVYGGPIITPTWDTKTSRLVAMSFLERLSDPKGNFRILSYPKTLDISELNSADGFKTVFSTQTSLPLKLQYLPINKM